MPGTDVWFCGKTSRAGGSEWHYVEVASDPLSPSADAVLAYAADAIVAVDTDLRVVLWNPAAERLFGWTFAEGAILRRHDGQRLAGTGQAEFGVGAPRLPGVLVGERVSVATQHGRVLSQAVDLLAGRGVQRCHDHQRGRGVSGGRPGVGHRRRKPGRTDGDGAGPEGRDGGGQALQVRRSAS